MNSTKYGCRVVAVNSLTLSFSRLALATALALAKFRSSIRSSTVIRRGLLSLGRVGLRRLGDWIVAARAAASARLSLRTDLPPK
jgi:hypothetical protein